MNENWRRIPLAELCEVFADGDWVESKDQSPGGIRLIQTGNVGNGIFKDRVEKARYVSPETFNRLRCTEIFEGDCLISRLPDPVGRSCILPSSEIRMITAVDCTILRFKSDEILAAFFNYYSQSNEYLVAVADKCTGTTRNRISRGNLSSVAIPVPSVSEQHRIVGILDEAFAGIATAKAHAEQNRQNARALFESHLQSAFMQRGERWARTTLGEAFDVRDGTHDSPKYQDTGYPLITSKNLKRAGLSFDNVKLISEQDYAKINERSAVHKGDVLFAMIGTIGNPTLVEVEPEFAIKNVALFKNPHGQSGAFLKHYLDSGWVREKMMKEAKGTTQKFVGLGYLRTFPVNLPPLKEQVELVEELNNLSTETQRLTDIYVRKLAALDELKKSLLHRAFSGEL